MVTVFNEDKEQMQRSNKELAKAQDIRRRLVNSYWKYFSEFSDEELSAMTDSFRADLKAGKTSFENVVPKAIAVFCEATRRTKKIQAHSNQIETPLILQANLNPEAKQMVNIAEVATGEGKTLIGAITAYLNVIAGDTVHIITANSYLAERDAESMRSTFEFCKVSVSAAVESNGKVNREEERAQLKKDFTSDVVYTTPETVGFAYLGDNSETDKKNQVIKKYDCVIIDEIDQCLLDEALNPLIHSQAAGYPPELYYMAQVFMREENITVRHLDNMKIDSAKEHQLLHDGRLSPKDPKYSVVIDESEGTIALTDLGLSQLGHYKDRLIRSIEASSYSKEKKEAILSIITREETDEFFFFVKNALQAQHFLKINKDYVVDNNEIKLIAASTGRLTKTTLSAGLHQALQVKENVYVTPENISTAEITRPAVFGLYKKATGVSGTINTNYQEFRDVYGLNVVQVPSYDDNRRIDHQDQIFLTKKEKIDAIIRQVIKCQASGQPILVGVTSERECEELSHLLDLYKIDHEALSAKDHKREAKIVANAGRPKAVTVVTNMAGRGTDIKLGGDVEGMIDAEVLNYMKRIIKPERVENAVQADVVNWPKMSLEEKEVRLQKARRATYNRIAQKLLDQCVTGKATPEVFAYYQSSIEKAKQRVESRYLEDKLAVEEAHGLFVLLTTKNDSRRLDNQLRGRSGRQGDPGDTGAMISLEDDFCRRVFKENEIKTLGKMLREGKQKQVIDAIDHQQILLENAQRDYRQASLSMSRTDDRIRTEYYRYRNALTDDKTVPEALTSMAMKVYRQSTERILSDKKHVSKEEFQELRSVFPIFSRRTPLDCAFVRKAEAGMMERDELMNYMKTRTKTLIRNYANENPENLQSLKEIVLRTGDSYWSEYVESRKMRRVNANNRSFAGENPIQEYSLDKGFDFVKESLCQESVFKALEHINQSLTIRRPVSTLEVHKNKYEQSPTFSSSEILELARNSEERKNIPKSFEGTSFLQRIMDERRKASVQPSEVSNEMLGDSISSTPRQR